MKVTLKFLDTPLIEVDVSNDSDAGPEEQHNTTQSEKTAGSKEDRVANEASSRGNSRNNREYQGALKRAIDWLMEKDIPEEAHQSRKEHNNRPTEIKDEESPEEDQPAESNEHSEEEYRQAAIRDYLTGAFNRRYFDEIIENEVSRASRYNHPIGFLMVDIDRFKQINDEYSHMVGDKVLQTVADLLQRNVRNADTVIRYGGDEFLILLPETDGEAERIKTRIQEEVNGWTSGDGVMDISISLAIGSSHWHPEQDRDIEEALEEADCKMYQDKQRKGASN